MPLSLKFFKLLFISKLKKKMSVIECCVTGIDNTFFLEGVLRNDSASEPNTLGVPPYTPLRVSNFTITENLLWGAGRNLKAEFSAVFWQRGSRLVVSMSEATRVNIRGAGLIISWLPS